MADVHTEEQRSRNMQAIKSTNTSIELLVRKTLHQCGFRFRLYCKDLPGRPDLVLKKYNSVVFINGCYWHQHDNCRFAAKPKTNSSFWINKLEKNKKRDLKNNAELETLGWNVIVIWECELKKDSYETINRLKNELVRSKDDTHYRPLRRSRRPK